MATWRRLGIGNIRLLVPAALLLAALTLLSSPALAQSPPDTPSSVTVDRSDGSLTASWKAPARAETYHVTYSSDGGAELAPRRSESSQQLHHHQRSGQLQVLHCGSARPKLGRRQRMAQLLRHRPVQPARASTHAQAARNARRDRRLTLRRRSLTPSGTPSEERPATT